MGMHMWNTSSLMCLVTTWGIRVSGYWYLCQGPGQRTHILVQTQAFALTGNKVVLTTPPNLEA